MAGNTSNISFRVDTDIKNQAESVLAELGMNMTTAFNIF
jgi:DNA-damage-inducible protein J